MFSELQEQMNCIHEKSLEKPGFAYELGKIIVIIYLKHNWKEM